jgi:hypothetical protein
VKFSAKHDEGIAVDDELGDGAALLECGADVSCAVAAMGVRARMASVASARRLCRIVCGNYAYEEEGLSAVTSGEGCAGAASIEYDSGFTLSPGGFRPSLYQRISCTLLDLLLTLVAL